MGINVREAMRKYLKEMNLEVSKDDCFVINHMDWTVSGPFPMDLAKDQARSMSHTFRKMYYAHKSDGERIT